MDDLTKERKDDSIPLRSIIREPHRIRLDRIKGGHEHGHVQWWNEVFEPPPMQDQAYRHPHFMKEQEHLSSTPPSSPSSPPTSASSTMETETELESSSETGASGSLPTINHESDATPQ